MAMGFNFKGLMAPVFTPFSRKTGELDLSKIKEYAQHLIKNGVNGVLVNGTVGEGVCMSIQERKTVLETWSDAVKGTPLHLMVQIGGVCLRDVQELARHAEERGVSSLLCLPDLFHRPSGVSELVRYLTMVSHAAPKTPLLYYHIPSCTGVTLDMVEFLKMADSKIPTLVGIKFTHNNLEEGSQCVRVNDSKFKVLLGNDKLIAAGFFEGFDSLIATNLSMFAPLIRDIQEGIKNGQVSQVQTKQLKLITIIDTITKYGNWVPTMKEAMYIITGFDFGRAREPQGILSESQVKQLRADLASLGLAK